MNNESILYERKDLYQWRLDREQLSKDESNHFFNISSKINLRKLFPETNKDIAEFYSSQLEWQFAVPDQKGTLLAILQENFLEIRQKRDDYQKPIGRAAIPIDENPKWRKLTWSSDGILVAFSTSNGTLSCYNTLANLICFIPNIDNTIGLNSMIPVGAVVSLFLLEMRTKRADWPYELLVLDFYGNLRSYLISSTQGYEPYHTFSFSENIITAATYIPLFNMLIIASPTLVNQKSLEETKGLSSWRLLKSFPYYRIVDPSEENFCPMKKTRQWVFLSTNNKKRNIPLKIMPSVNSMYLTCLYSCGSVIIWTMPRLKIFQIWKLQDLCYNFNVSKKGISSKNPIKKFLFSDICWCLDAKLAVIRLDGLLVISAHDKFENLLGQINLSSHSIDCQPEQLNAYAKLANIGDLNTGFLILDCKIREFTSWRRESEILENSTIKQDDSISGIVEVADNHSFMRQILKFFMYFEIFHQQKKFINVERTYNLITLKKITPEELYDKKIDNEEYEEALEFAKLFNVDENRIYKKQWNNSYPITLESIENYLLKVTDKWWIIHQCCEKIPETLISAKALINYGLQYTDFDVFLECGKNSKSGDDNNFSAFKDDELFKFNVNETVTNFPKSQLHIVQLRRHLLLYWDVLTIYEEIIHLDYQNTSYNEEMYKKFRTESPFLVALNFARDGNACAIAVLFKYYSCEISALWLKILDNIPECIPPSNYKEILPKFNKHNNLVKWECKYIREADWSESGQFKNLYKLKLYQEENSDIHFPFSKKEILEWYESKIKAIIEKTGLIDYALELLNLANKNNISELEHLRHNLLVLDTLMYELELENVKSLSEIEKLTEFDKLLLLMSETNTEESFLNNISNILLPFLNRCEKVKPNTQDVLFEDYLKHLSQYDLNLPLVFFTYISEKHKSDLFFNNKRILELGLLSVYACERLDQTDIAMKIIQYLPEFSENNNLDFEEMFNLQSKLTELQLELDIMQLLQSYGIEKTVNYLHENKTNIHFQKDTLTAMVNAKINTKMISKDDVYLLLDDMKFVQENFFSSLSYQTYLRIFSYIMLTLGRNDCIEEYAPLVLCCSLSESSLRKSNSTLSYDESVTIIIEAAQYYFNIASSSIDSSILLAESCLSLINSHPNVERERKLIKALKELNAFGVIISPLQVRMSVNKIKIIEKVLKLNPKSYKKIERLLSLAENLDFDAEDKHLLEFEVVNCAINSAFEIKDYAWCSYIIEKIYENKKSCWNICKRLCECEEFDDLETKQKLIKLAIMECPEKEIINLTELRNDIERNALQKRLQNSMRILQNTTDNKIINNDYQNLETKLCNEAEPDSTLSHEFETFQGIISIPSFVKMLQSPSSNVLNFQFWKNTFNFSVKGNECDLEINPNGDCEKLGFPEFYEELHELCEGCICFLNKKQEKKIEILRLLLRYYLLSRNSSVDAYSAITTNIYDVIVQLSVSSFPNDCLLSLCFLLSLKNNQKYCENVFNSLPTTISVRKFGLYYYSLKFLLSCNFSIQNLILEKTPAELISLAQSKPNSDSLYFELSNKYRYLLEKHQKIITLQKMDCGIDFQRFFSDDIYKVDSILGLAMYEERSKLDLALSLGKEYNVSSEDIILSHICSLFLTRNLDILISRLKEPELIEILKKNSKYTANKLISDIYDGLFGCDYQILLIFYTLLHDIAGTEVFHLLKPKEHIELLMNLKSIINKIDYKLLTADRPQIVEAVFPIVFVSHQNDIMNILSCLPENLTRFISLEDLYERLAQKIFFNGPATCSFLKRVEYSLVFLEKTSEKQIIHSVKEFLFSKYSSENIDNNMKKMILNLSIDFLSKYKYDNLVEKLNQYMKKFPKLEEFNVIFNALNINEEYFRILSAAFLFDDKTEMNEIVLKMIIDPLVPTDEIKIILEIIHLNSLTDIITDVLNNKNISDLELILQRMENCIEENEYERCWINSLKCLIEKNEIPKNIKIEIKKMLEILERSDEEIYSIIELLHETRLILREWLSSHLCIRIFDVIDETSRLNLIQKLLQASTSFAHFMYLYKLLILWPAFTGSQEWKNDPWQILLNKLLSQDDIHIPMENELKLVYKIVVKQKFSKEIRRAFFNHIGNMNHNKILLVWFCILTKDELLIQSVKGYLEELRLANKMPKIIEDYLNKKLIV